MPGYHKSFHSHIGYWSKALFYQFNIELANSRLSWLTNCISSYKLFQPKLLTGNLTIWENLVENSLLSMWSLIPSHHLLSMCSLIPSHHLLYMCSLIPSHQRLSCAPWYPLITYYHVLPDTFSSPIYLVLLTSQPCSVDINPVHINSPGSTYPGCSTYFVNDHLTCWESLKKIWVA